MKIAFVIYSLHLGGAERVVSLLSKELAQQHIVKIILFSSEIGYSYGGEIIGIDCPSHKNIISKGLNVFKRINRLKKIFDREKFDYVFSFMESANIPTILTGFKVNVSVRNNPNKFHSLTRLAMKIFYPKAHKVVTVSKQIQSYLISKIRLKNVETIYNPIDFSIINKLSKKNVEFDFDYIIAIGRLHYQKGFDLLIKAFAQSNTKNYTKLIIIGEGEQRYKLEKLSDVLKISENVIFPGKANNPYKYLANAKLFVLSSRYEGFPNALIESLACSCPSIATNCDFGPGEIIENNLNGILVENQNIKELSFAIDRVYFNKELQNRFKLNSEKSIEHLDIKKIAFKWLTL